MSDYQVDEQTTNVLEPLCHWGGYFDHRAFCWRGTAQSSIKGRASRWTSAIGDHFDDRRGSETPLVATLAHDHWE